MLVKKMVDHVVFSFGWYCETAGCMDEEVGLLCCGHRPRSTLKYKIGRQITRELSFISNLDVTTVDSVMKIC